MTAEAPCGGIDLGGTKIEARLLDGAGALTRAVRRVPTPAHDFDAMVGALAAEVAWLEGLAGGPIPVGLAAPGVVDATTGAVHAANLPGAGRSLAAALRERSGRAVTLVNDGTAFALSEARGGAGEGARVVVGLVIGTGLGGGVCIDGAAPPRHAGLGLEVGHLGASARALAAHGLPSWPCACGRSGCLEAYVSGPGLARLAAWRTGAPVSAAARRDEATLTVWADLMGEVLATVQAVLDPDRIVLGGGVSGTAGIEGRLAGALARHRLSGARAPEIRVARHGDGSGARGAGLLARDRAAGRC